MESLLRTSDLIYGFMSQVSPEWPRITAASLLTVTNYEKAWQRDLNLFIRLSNRAVEKRKIPGVNNSFYKLKIHDLVSWKMHIFLIKPCWFPCKPSRHSSFGLFICSCS